MTKPTKIALSASRDIPFNQLVLSQSNVRRVKAGVSIDALAADIARRGLLQSLTVRAQCDEAGAETGKFEVPAGGRRFRALQQLVKAKRLSRTAPVPCIVREDDEISAEEDSLAENTHREALHPLDQFRAMQQLAGQGSDVETIAATFMTTPAVVKQRLRLASVSPRLHDIYAEDGMTLEQLMAFSVSEDHARQEQVWELLQSSHNKQPWMIRHKLTEETVRASDKRVRFVGLDAYQAAGGYVLRDLFEADDGGWVQDVALLDALVDEKLKAEADRIAGEGWKWVAVAVEFPYDADAGMRMLEGEQPPLTDEQEARLEALRREAEQLENDWSGKPEVPDEIDARVTAIDEEIAAIVERPLAYDPEEVARAGVFVSIDRMGVLDIDRGYVRPEDEPGVEIVDDEVPDPDALAERADADEEAMGGGGELTAPDAGEDEEEQEDPGKPLHAACWYRPDRDDVAPTPASMPALISAVTDLDGAIMGVHRTWLDSGGLGKAPVAVPRRAMGELLRHGVRFGGAGPVMVAGEGTETILSLRMAMPRLPMIAALSAAHLAAIRFPPPLRRLYVAREEDGAGRAAFGALETRTTAAGIELLPLDSVLDDFNADLCAFGTAKLAERLRPQLRTEDRAAFL